MGTSGVCWKTTDGQFKKARFCGVGHKCDPNNIFDFVGSCPPSGCPGAIRDGLSFNWYSCDGWNHNPILSLGTTGVCFKLPTISNTTANFQHTRSCPSGQTQGIDGFCYSCPAGFTNVLGVCTKIDNGVANFNETAGFLCGAGEFLSGASCYTCPTGRDTDLRLRAQAAGVGFMLS